MRVSFSEMFEGIFPHIANGISDLAIEPFEPLGISKISVARNNGQVVTLNGSFNNLKIRGPSNATVAKAQLSLEKKLLNFDLEIPKLRINATYNLRGKVNEPTKLFRVSMILIINCRKHFASSANWLRRCKHSS